MWDGCQERVGRGSMCARSREDSAADFPSSRSSSISPTIPSSSHDWRAFRAQLVAWERHGCNAAKSQSGQQRLQRPRGPALVHGDSWAHPIVEPEPGCLLLARNDDMNFFRESVVLITSHDDAVGSIGYVLNKPSPLTVDELQVLGAASGFKEAFGSQRLLLGGPVHLDHVTLLHRYMGIARSHKIAEGMYMGGLPDAIRLINAGIAQPSDFLLVLGMSGWSAGQLRQEVASGFWHVISASPDLVLPTGGAAGSDATAAAATTTAATAASTGGEGPTNSRCSPAAEQGSPAAPPSAGPAAPGSKLRPAPSPMYRRIARLAVRGGV